MKNFLISLFCVAFLTYSLGLFLPWWSVALAGFLTGVLIDQKRVVAFFSAFLGSFMVWSLLSLIISINNNHILAGKISMIVLKNNSPVLLVLVTGLIGGVTAGFSALSGRSISIIFRNR
jgi:hypothetical protein